MAFKHTVVVGSADIPSRYTVVRRAFEASETQSRLSRQQKSIVKDFMGNANRKVHPFFNQSRFIENDAILIRDRNLYIKRPLSDRVYNRIKPALRLATILLERHISLWLLLLYGREIHDEDCNSYLDEKNFADDNPDQFREEFLKVDLPRMAKFMNFASFERTSADDAGMSTIAWAENRGLEIPENPHFIILMSCTEDIWAPFQENSHWDHFIHEEKCNHWVNLAIILIHEFGHCLALYRERELYVQLSAKDDTSPNILDDPLTPFWPAKEHGYAFEMAAHGGIFDMFPLSHALKGSIFTHRGSRIARMRFMRDNNVDNTYHLDIAPETIVALMQEETWRGDREVEFVLG